MQHQKLALPSSAEGCSVSNSVAGKSKYTTPGETHTISINGGQGLCRRCCGQRRVSMTTAQGESDASWAVIRSTETYGARVDRVSDSEFVNCEDSAYGSFFTVVKMAVASGCLVDRR